MRRRAGTGDAGSDGEGAGTLEIEFEDGDESPQRAASAAGRPRDLRGAALAALAAVTLGAALTATHHTGSSDTESMTTSIVAVPPNYSAYMVTVSYQGSHLVSLQQRRIAVDLRITPVPGARVWILDYYVKETGVVSGAMTPPPRAPLPTSGVDAGGEPPRAPLPASGIDAELELTVDDCATVPIGESMGSVNVLSQGPAGITDRFTILGERFTSDLARLLRTVCPARSVAGGTD